MNIYINKFLILFFGCLFIFSNYIVAQNYLEGNVFSKKDSLAINAASIYFDGTTIGTVSNDKGYFKIPYKDNNSLLVISYLSTETTYINLKEVNFKDKQLKIYLDEKLEELDAVQLEPDTWSREKKIRIFKRQFIGTFPTWSYCKIEDEDAIKIRYLPSSNTLVANSRTPIIIKNKKLGYRITYNLIDFEVNFKKSPSGLTLPYKVYNEGSSFFEPLKKRTSKKIIENRKKSYLGSLLHFFRALRDKELNEKKFEIFYERFRVSPYKYFDILTSGTRKSVTLKAERVDILYNGLSQSNFAAKSVFYLDEYGNHFPPDAVLIGGDMGEKRISDLLPLNYEYDK